MFGMFKPTNALFGGLLWKNPWRISKMRKRRHRERLRRVDGIVALLDNVLKRDGLETKAMERWKAEMPTEAEMRPKDKYTLFDPHSKSYRKGIHKLPKWTRLSQRVNPPGF